MPATLTTVNAILKEVYEPKIQDLQHDAVALKRIEKSSDGVISEVGGKYVTFPLHTRRNSGIGARNERSATYCRSAGLRIGSRLAALPLWSSSSFWSDDGTCR